MEDIKRITISLLESYEDSSINEDENKKEYIKRSSGRFNIDEALEAFPEKEVIDNKENFIETVSDLIYRQLLEETKGKYDIDGVGVWIETAEETYDNSMAIQTLKDIGDSRDDLTPIFELIKMTLPISEES